MKSTNTNEKCFWLKLYIYIAQHRPFHYTSKINVKANTNTKRSLKRKWNTYIQKKES